MYMSALDLGKGNSEVIDLDFRRRADFLHFICLHGCSGEAAPETVDALVVGEHSPVTDAAVYLVAHDLFDFELDLAVVKKQHVTGAHVARQLLVVQADAPVDTHLAVGIEHEGISWIQSDLAVLEPADPDLGALEVAHDGDRTPGFAASLAHQLGTALVVPGGPVRNFCARRPLREKHRSTSEDRWRQGRVATILVLLLIDTLRKTAYFTRFL
jgi:hypothetical protein